MTSLLPPPRRSRAARGPTVGPYADRSLLNGARPVNWLYRLLVAAALSGEIAAFWIVLSVLFGDWWWITLLGTVGFAGLSYGLAHLAGVSLKEWRCAGRGAAAPFSLALIWLGLGSAAFIARLYSSPGPSPAAGAAAGVTYPAAGAVPPAGVDAAAGAGAALVSALFFAALFLGSGCLAAYLAYRAHNPDLTALNSSGAARATAAEPRETALMNLGRLDSRRRELLDTLDNADTYQEHTRREREAVVCALKTRGRQLVAAGGSAEACDDAMHDAPRPS